MMWSYIFNSSRDHPNSACAKFFEKLTLLTLWYAHVCVQSGGKRCQFFGKFVYVLSDWFATGMSWRTFLRTFWGKELQFSTLTHFRPMFPFNTPWKHQKTFDFLVFSKGIKWEHWSEVGETGHVSWLNKFTSSAVNKLKLLHHK